MKRGQPKPLLEWNFSELLKVAKASPWVPAGLALNGGWNSRKALIGDHAEVVRMVRNLVHPARYVEDHYGSRVTGKYLNQVVRLCSDWLAERNNRTLREHMKAEGIL
jgi:hypothetical protein